MGHNNRDRRREAEKSAKSAFEYAQKTARANRVNQYTPWGNTIYNENPDGTWSVRQELPDDLQSLLTQQRQTQAGMLGGAQQALSQLNYGPVIAGSIQRNLDLSGLPELRSSIDTSGMAAYAVAPGQTAQDAIMARLQPALTRQKDQLRTELVNQGFNLSDQGYAQGMDEFNRQANDAYTQAGLYGINLAMQQRGQQFGEAQTQAELANSANQQAYAQRLGAANYGLQAQNQEWNQAYENANRPAMLASMLASGGLGQPVQAPGAYGINVPEQNRVDGVDYLGAIQVANQGRQANASSRAGLFSGIGSILGSGIGAAGYYYGSRR